MQTNALEHVQQDVGGVGVCVCRVELPLSGRMTHMQQTKEGVGEVERS